MKKEITRVLLSLIGTIILILLGMVSAEYINANYNLTTNYINNIRLGSASLIAWAVFGRLYNFESYKGKTLIEKLKQVWFITTYSIGFYGVVLSLKLYSNAQV